MEAIFGFLNENAVFGLVLIDLKTGDVKIMTSARIILLYG